MNAVYHVEWNEPDALEARALTYTHADPYVACDHARTLIARGACNVIVIRESRPSYHTALVSLDDYV